MTHRYHPDPERNDPPDAILWDDCEDCAVRAEMVGLDSSNCRKAIALMLSVERGQGGHYRTKAERNLCNQLSRAYLVFENAGMIGDRYAV